MKYLENLMQGESGGTYMQRLRSWACQPPLVTLGPSTSSSAVLYSRCIGRWRRPTAITNKQTNKQTLYGFCYQPAKKGIHQKQVDSLWSVSFLYWYKRFWEKMNKQLLPASHKHKSWEREEKIFRLLVISDQCHFYIGIKRFWEKMNNQLLPGSKLSVLANMSHQVRSDPYMIGAPPLRGGAST